MSPKRTGGAGVHTSIAGWAIIEVTTESSKSLNWDPSPGRDSKEAGRDDIQKTSEKKNKQTHAFSSLPFLFPPLFLPLFFLYLLAFQHMSPLVTYSTNQNTDPNVDWLLDWIWLPQDFSEEDSGSTCVGSERQTCCCGGEEEKRRGEGIERKANKRRRATEGKKTGTKKRKKPKPRGNIHASHGGQLIESFCCLLPNFRGSGCGQCRHNEMVDIWEVIKVQQQVGTWRQRDHEKGNSGNLCKAKKK